MADEPKPVADDPFLSDVDTSYHPETPDGAPPKKVPPKDPETGRFVKSDPPAAKPAPKHPDYLTSQAREYGFTEDEIGDLSTPALGRAVNRIMQDRLTVAQQVAHFRTLEDNRVKAPPPEPAPETGFDEEALLTAGYDPGLIRTLKATAEQAKEITALKAKLKESEDREQRRQDLTNEEILDTAFDALPERLHKLIGKGAMGDLTPNSPERQRRINLLVSAGLNPKQLPARGTVKAALLKAADLMWPEDRAPERKKSADDGGAYAEPPTPPPGAPSLAEWDRAGVAVPTQRTPVEEPPGDAKAIHALERRFAEQKATTSDTEVMNGMFK